jgi:hypothetical protein
MLLAHCCCIRGIAAAIRRRVLLLLAVLERVHVARRRRRSSSVAAAVFVRIAVACAALRPRRGRGRWRRAQAVHHRGGGHRGARRGFRWHTGSARVQGAASGGSRPHACAVSGSGVQRCSLHCCSSARGATPWRPRTRQWHRAWAAFRQRAPPPQRRACLQRAEQTAAAARSAAPARASAAPARFTAGRHALRCTALAAHCAAAPPRCVQLAAGLARPTRHAAAPLLMPAGQPEPRGARSLWRRAPFQQAACSHAPSQRSQTRCSVTAHTTLRDQRRDASPGTRGSSNAVFATLTAHAAAAALQPPQPHAARLPRGCAAAMRRERPHRARGRAARRRGGSAGVTQQQAARRRAQTAAAVPRSLAVWRCF